MMKPRVIGAFLYLYFYSSNGFQVFDDEYGKTRLSMQFFSIFEGLETNP